jgi:hypothetical protein
MVSPTVSRSVYLGIRYPSEAHDHVLVLSDSFGFADVAPSLMKERVCSLQLLSTLKPKLYYDLLSVSQSVLASGTHLGPETNFLSFFNHL